MKQSGKPQPVTSVFLALCLCLIVQSGCSREGDVAGAATPPASNQESSATAEFIAPKEPEELTTQTPAATSPPAPESPPFETAGLAEEPLTLDEPVTATALIEQAVIEETVLLASEDGAEAESALLEETADQLQEPEFPVQENNPPPVKEDIAPAQPVELETTQLTGPETELPESAEPDLSYEAQTAVTQPAEFMAEQAAEPESEPEVTLDLDSMETRLRETKAMGLFTKLEIKGQVKDLIKEMDKYHEGRSSRELDDLHEQFDLLMMKLLVLLQDSDPDLHLDIALARPALWTTLSDPVQFNTVKGP